MGLVYGQDQIKKVNFVYRGLYAHVKTLIREGAEGFELMQAHTMAEYLDTPELSRLFREVPFLSPAEKRALVRSAIFDVSLGRELPPVEDPNTDQAGVRRVEPAAPLEKFTPPAFSLNVNRSEAFHGKAPADTPAPAPIVTNTAGKDDPHGGR